MAVIESELETLLGPYGLSRLTSGRHHLRFGLVHGVWVVIQWHLVRSVKTGLQAQLFVQAEIPRTQGLSLHAVVRRADAQDEAAPGWSAGPHGLWIAHRGGMEMEAQRALVSRLTESSLRQLRDGRVFPEGISLVSRWLRLGFGEEVEATVCAFDSGRVDGLWAQAALPGQQRESEFAARLQALARVAQELSGDLGRVA